MSARVIGFCWIAQVFLTQKCVKQLWKRGVGDDRRGVDPTINRPKSLAADITGEEASLFESSGSVGNLAVVLSTILINSNCWFEHIY